LDFSCLIALVFGRALGELIAKDCFGRRRFRSILVGGISALFRLKL
jgi:hypothetical protein